ncbi:transcription termination factor MTERF6, chloroplastic/mitochondrial-like [Pistacia vera]|uniref:transcription termination factor MTERF6, chloroplastic/mitochondrial-like n=1 Tax=Pistacia vera TaxID=55513 RepID=UPI001262FB82|nr:transcription termination factor MTERF6, chloroplastic/mitochondrial-like [Pistacia vera]
MFIMFRFLCRTTRKVIAEGDRDRDLALNLTTTQLGFSQNKIFPLRFLSSSSHVGKRALKTEQSEQEESLTLSYLINSCGLSLKCAVSASKLIQLKNTERADSVLRFLSDHGFIETQISKVVKGCPRVISFDPEKTLSPKIEFFRSMGVSRDEVAEIIARTPPLLSRSLKNHLIPNYNFLKNVVIDDKKVVTVLKRMGRGLLQDLRSKNLGPNIALLKDIGVPHSGIIFLVTNTSSAARSKHSKFCRIVDKVKEMGFDPTQIVFVMAVGVISQLKESVWESKFEVYRRWGWSEDETRAAFRKHPYCMLISEEKITRGMDFLVNRMGWLSRDISKWPEGLFFSLEKRIAPRCFVIQHLLSKGLIREDISPTAYLKLTEGKFMDMYITRFHEKVPQLLDVYEGKIDFLDVNPEFQRSVK